MMGEPSAFQATYSDWKLIKSRSVVQIVLEVPLELADHAYDVLGGMPKAGSETWCAVARLQPGTPDKQDQQREEPRTETPRQAAARPDGARSWSGMPPSQQAGVLCNDESFWRYLTATTMRVYDANAAARAVREYCDVSSRKDLNTNHKARVLWHQLVEDFRVWQRYPDLAA